MRFRTRIVEDNAAKPRAEENEKKLLSSGLFRVVASLGPVGVACDEPCGIQLPNRELARGPGCGSTYSTALNSTLLAQLKV
jgi:hypothetical protein